MCHCAIVYPTSGIKEYYKYIYILILECIIQHYQDELLHTFHEMFYGIKQFIYNKISIFVLYFIIKPEETDRLHDLISYLSNIKINETLIRKAIDTTLMKIKYDINSSTFIAEDSSLHFLKSKKT